MINYKEYLRLTEFSGLVVDTKLEVRCCWKNISPLQNIENQFAFASYSQTLLPNSFLQHFLSCICKFHLAGKYF